MADLTPVITELTRINHGGRAPGSVLARVSCQVGGLLLIGLRLEYGPGNVLRISNATHKGGRGDRALGVVILDEALRAEILSAARAAYLADTPEAGLLRFLAPSRRRR